LARNNVGLMRTIVQKYGGTSVGSVELIQRVAEKVAAVRAGGDNIAVVVSAMGDSTDRLVDLAAGIAAEPNPREMDVLVKIRDADIAVLERYGRHVPADLMVVLRRALARRREDRFPTTGAYVDGLEEVARRRRLVIWMGAGLLLRPGSLARGAPHEPNPSTVHVPQNVNTAASLRRSATCAANAA